MKRFLLLLPYLLIFSAKAQISLAPYQIMSLGSHAEVVAIADLNNDGLNDLAVGTTYALDTANDFKLFVYIQNTSGQLLPAVKYSYTRSLSSAESICTGDFNNDGLTDVVIGFGDSIGIFFQNSTGTFNPIVSYYSGSGADCVKGGDLNHDGLQDIAVCHWNSNYIKLFYQTVTGFTTQTLARDPGGYDEIDVGDLNGDGLDDIAWVSGNNNQGMLQVYTQRATGSFNAPVTYYAPYQDFDQLMGLAIGDLNNDGKNDVVATGLGNRPDARIVIWFQDPSTGLLDAPYDTFAYDIPEPVEVADLNCDGKNEIVTAHSGWEKISVYDQNPSGIYDLYDLFDNPGSSHYNPEGLALGDLNNDGKKDIALADRQTGLILWYNISNASCTPLSIDNDLKDAADRMTVFPNPFSYTAVLTLSNQHYLNATLKIYNPLGSLVKSEIISGQSVVINREGLRDGIYFISVTDGENEYRGKMVVE